MATTILELDKLAQESEAAIDRLEKGQASTSSLTLEPGT
jgi:hypothetical protein